MKKILCLLITLSLCATAQTASKTEVVVKKGLVKTSTARGDTLVSPGQKAVLEEGKDPAVAMTDKLVEKLLLMHQQLHAERAQSKDRIDHTLITSWSIEQENLWKVGAIMTFSNQSDKPEKIVRFGPTSPPVEGIDFFTLDGLPIEYKKEKISDTHDYYYLYFDKPVEPKKDFEALLIKEMNDSMPWFAELKKMVLTQQNGLWQIHNQNDTPCSLNYQQFVLPKSAIFVKSDPPADTVEEQDGRVSVTIRKYVGQDGWGSFKVFFLWPEKDGTCLKGIPWDKAGPEALQIYELFIREDIQSPELWGELAIKLVGGHFYEQAYDAFERCHNGHTSAVWDYTALTWQGHLLDLEQERAKAVEKYQQALAVKPEGDMRHEQWGIVLDKKWIQRRIEAPFTENMLFYPELNYREPPLDSAIETGVRVGDIPLNITKDEVLKKLGEPKTIFYREQSYTLNDLPEKYYFVYPDISLMIIDSRVKEITTRSSFYHFPNGIKTGDSEQEVIKAFGTKYKRKETSIKIYLEYEDLKLMFEVEKPQMQVVEINVGPLQ